MSEDGVISSMMMDPPSALLNSLFSTLLIPHEAHITRRYSEVSQCRRTSDVTYFYGFALSFMFHDILYRDNREKNTHIINCVSYYIGTIVRRIIKLFGCEMQIS